MTERIRRLKECLRVILSKNLESVACTLFISTLGLDSTPFVLYINPYCTFVPSLSDLEIFYLSFSSLAFGGFYFLFLFIVAQLHECVLSLVILLVSHPLLFL